MILITGATGRIGHLLTQQLSQQAHKIRVLVRQNSDTTLISNLPIEFIYGDITDYNSVEKAVQGCEYVYHLAGDINISNKHQTKTLAANVVGVDNIIQACIKHNIKRLLYTSSVHAFQPPDENSVLTEKEPLCDAKKSHGIYDRTKSLATCKVLENAKTTLDAVVVCPTGVTGPYDYRPSFFGLGMIDSVKSGLKFAVPGGYDYVDVRDVVDGIILAMNKGKRGELYLLGGEYLTIESYYKTLKEITGIKSKTVYLPLWFAKILGWVLNIFSKRSPITPYSIETLSTNTHVDHGKASRELGYSPRPIRESIIDQYNWFKKQGRL